MDTADRGALNALVKENKEAAFYLWVFRDLKLLKERMPGILEQMPGFDLEQSDESAQFG